MSFSKEKTFVSIPKGDKALMFDMPSKTTEGITYKIRVMPQTGEVCCSCKANVLGNFQCSHIQDFLKVYNPKRQKLVKDIDPLEVVREDFERDIELEFSDEVVDIIPNVEI